MYLNATLKYDTNLKKKNRVQQENEDKVTVMKIELKPHRHEKFLLLRRTFNQTYYSIQKKRKATFNSVCIQLG